MTNEELQKQIDDLKKKLDELPRYFGRRFSTFLASKNLSDTDGWKFDETDGTVEFRGGISKVTSITITQPSGTIAGSIQSLGAGEIAIFPDEIATEGITLNSVEEVYPNSDNAITLGTASFRWADVRSVLINGADIGFANGYKFREYPLSAENVSKPDEWMKEHANQGVQLLDENDNLIAVFHKNGNIYGNIKPLSELNNA